MSSAFLSFNIMSLWEGWVVAVGTSFSWWVTVPGSEPWKQTGKADSQESCRATGPASMSSDYLFSLWLWLCPHSLWPPNLEGNCYIVGEEFHQNTSSFMHLCIYLGRVPCFNSSSPAQLTGKTEMKAGNLCWIKNAMSLPVTNPGEWGGSLWVPSVPYECHQLF